MTPVSFSHSSPFLPCNRNAAVTVIQMVSGVSSLNTPSAVWCKRGHKRKHPCLQAQKPFMKGPSTNTFGTLWSTAHTWSTEERIMVHKRFGWQMKGGRKRCQNRLNFGTSPLWTASTSRGHAAVTGGEAPVNGGWHNIPRRVLGREGKGGEGRAPRTRGRPKTPTGGLGRGRERGGGGGEGRWGWRGAGVHEALWCHRNVSPCQVQSSLAVIFWAIRVLILRTLASWQTRRLAEGVPHSYTGHTHTHTYWNTHRHTHTSGLIGILTETNNHWTTARNQHFPALKSSSSKV